MMIRQHHYPEQKERPTTAKQGRSITRALTTGRKGKPAGLWRPWWGGAICFLLLAGLSVWQGVKQVQGNNPAPAIYEVTATRQLATGTTTSEPLVATFDFRRCRLRLQTTVPAREYEINFLQSPTNESCRTRLRGGGLPPQEWIDLSPCADIVSSRGVTITYRTAHDQAVIHLSPPPIVELRRMWVSLPQSDHADHSTLRPGKYVEVHYEFTSPIPTLVRVNETAPDRVPELRLVFENHVLQSRILAPLPAGSCTGSVLLPVEGDEMSYFNWQQQAGISLMRLPGSVNSVSEKVKRESQAWSVSWDMESLIPSVISGQDLSREWIRVAAISGEVTVRTGWRQVPDMATVGQIDTWFGNDLPEVGDPTSPTAPFLSVVHERIPPVTFLVLHQSHPWDTLIIRNKNMIVSVIPVWALEMEVHEDGRVVKPWRVRVDRLWMGGVNPEKGVEVSLMRQPGQGHTIALKHEDLPEHATRQMPWPDFQLENNRQGEVHLAWPRGVAPQQTARAHVHLDTPLPVQGDPVWIPATLEVPGVCAVPGGTTAWQRLTLIPWLPPEPAPETPLDWDRWHIRTDQRVYRDMEPVELMVWIPSTAGTPAGENTGENNNEVEFFLTVEHPLAFQYPSEIFSDQPRMIKNICVYPDEHPLLAAMPVGCYPLRGQRGQWNTYVLPPAITTRPYHVSQGIFGANKEMDQMTCGWQIPVLYIHQQRSIVAGERYLYREHHLARKKIMCADTNLLLRGKAHRWDMADAVNRNFCQAEPAGFPTLDFPSLYYPFGRGFRSPVAFTTAPPFSLLVCKPRQQGDLITTDGSHFDITSGPFRGVFYPTGSEKRGGVHHVLALGRDDIGYPETTEGQTGVALRQEPDTPLKVPASPVFPLRNPFEGERAHCPEWQGRPIVELVQVPVTRPSEVEVTFTARNFTYAVLRAGGEPTFAATSGTYKVKIPPGTNRVRLEIQLYQLGCTLDSTTVVLERDLWVPEKWSIGLPPHPSDRQTTWEGTEYTTGREKLKELGALWKSQGNPWDNPPAGPWRGMLVPLTTAETPRRTMEW